LAVTQDLANHTAWYLRDKKPWQPSDESVDEANDAYRLSTLMVFPLQIFFTIDHW